MAAVIPKNVVWIKDAVTLLSPEENTVHTNKSHKITYDFLVVASGLVMEPSMIEGLEEAIDKGVVCSNYTNPEHTWDVIKNFKGGNAVFTQPTTPIKCGGAPQKIAYLAADYFKRNEINDSRVIFATPGSVIFGVQPIRNTLMKVINRYGIHFKPFYSPFKIDVQQKIIYFKNTAKDENECIVTENKNNSESIISNKVTAISFDMLHIAPPQAVPKFIRNSILANENGWLDVHHNSLQHNMYKNIFGVGDVAALPTAKTDAAIRKQVPVLVDNLLKLLNEKKVDNMTYDGYSSCPLVTGYGKMTLAEFDYKGNFTPDPKLKQMLIFDSDKEHWRLWMLKKYGLPYLYWNKMLKGKDV